MFKGDRSAGDLNGFLDAGSHIQGELVFDDTFRVDGKLTGTVRSKGDLVVGEGGLVEADVDVGRLFVSGTLRGEVRASRRVELANSARVEGSIVCPTLVIEEGAKVDGRCITGGGVGTEMEKGASSAALGTTQVSGQDGDSDGPSGRLGQESRERPGSGPKSRRKPKRT